MALFERGKPGGTRRTTTPKPSTATIRQPTRGEKSTAEKAVQFTVGLLDFGASSLLPGVWAPGTPDSDPPGDNLNEFETTSLCQGIYGELELHPNAIIKIAQVATFAGVHGRFTAAVCLIAIPRLERRGILPTELAAKLSIGALLALSGSADESEADAVHMAAGRAHGGVGTNGRGQEHAGSVVGDSLSSILGGSFNQAGAQGSPGGVPDGDPDNGQRARQGESGGELGEDKGWLDEPSPGAVGGQTEVLGKVR